MGGIIGLAYEAFISVDNDGYEVLVKKGLQTTYKHMKIK